MRTEFRRENSGVLLRAWYGIFAPLERQKAYWLAQPLLAFQEGSGFIQLTAQFERHNVEARSSTFTGATMYIEYQKVPRTAALYLNGLWYDSAAVGCVACSLCAHAWEAAAHWDLSVVCWSCLSEGESNIYFCIYALLSYVTVFRLEYTERIT